MTTRAERIHQKETYAKKQAKIAKSRGYPKPKSTTHTSTSSATCGNSNCYMCGNPRKFFSELTIQEQREYQEKLNNEII